MFFVLSFSPWSSAQDGSTESRECCNFRWDRRERRGGDVDAGLSPSDLLSVTSRPPNTVSGHQPTAAGCQLSNLNPERERERERERGDASEEQVDLTKTFSLHPCSDLPGPALSIAPTDLI